MLQCGSCTLSTHGRGKGEISVADYAIVEVGGHQYRVSPGDVFVVERLEHETGSEVPLDRVLLLRQGDEVRVGHPTVDGARAVVRVLEHGRARKIRVFKYRAKKNYRRRYGHRQPFTRLVLERIETGA